MLCHKNDVNEVTKKYFLMKKTVNRHLLLLLLTQDWFKILLGQRLSLQRGGKNYCNLDMRVSGFQEQSGA